MHCEYFHFDKSHVNGHTEMCILNIIIYNIYAHRVKIEFVNCAHLKMSIPKYVLKYTIYLYSPRFIA